MAPVRSSARRGGQPEPSPVHDADTLDPTANKSLFLDPMLGTSLSMYVEKDVEDKDVITQMIVVSTDASYINSLSDASQTHGGSVSQGYSGVTYILGESPFLCGS
jgi:hypothetical protein